MLAERGVGPVTGAQLVISWSHPGRIRSEAAFARLGWVPYQSNGAVLPIDLETTSVMIFGFPVMLILYKSVQDDGRVNAVETAGMTAVFALIVFFLAVHG